MRSLRKPARFNYDLRGFLNLLEKNNDLVTIQKAVSSKFEISAIVSKFERKQAVMFERVRGSKIKVACNILGTRKRFSMAVGTSDESLIHSHIIKSLSSSCEPRRLLGRAPFDQNSSRNLLVLPIVTHFEKDAGPYITSSIVFVKDHESGNQNSSTHRLLRLDDRHMVIRMVEGRHLHKCFTYAKDHGEDLKIAIAIGVHPSVSIAAAYQAAYGVDEMLIANSLLENQLTLSKLDYSQLFVPTHAEIVLEGRILRDKTQEEWMVEMLKTYDLKRQQPMFELERIRFRENAIFHDILPGFAEHRLLMGMPVEAKLLGDVRNAVTNTKAVYLTEGGSSWLTAVIQIKKRLEGEPKNVIIAALASHRSLKIVIVVDEDIDPTNPIAVEYALSTRCQADRDLVIIPNAKGSSLDPSSDQHNLLTAKLGIDATATLLKAKDGFEIAKIPGEENLKVSDYVSYKHRKEKSVMTDSSQQLHDLLDESSNSLKYRSQNDV
ncbi:MAG: UbiD family decarboxylase [Nitrososphaeraceae archaeon]|jgi:UbiD family decarboxylase